MNGLRIYRGRDIGFYVDEEVLFGVTEFSAVEEKKYHAVREYMSAKPVAEVAQGSVYRLKICFLTAFDRQLPENGSFRLRMVCGTEEYVYDGCRVTECHLGAKGEKDAQAVYTLEAEDCAYREVEVGDA